MIAFEPLAAREPPMRRRPRRFAPVAVLVAVFVALALRPPPAGAAGPAEEKGVDCEKAVSTPEIAACAKEAYEAADKRLNDAYRAVLASIEKTDVPPEARTDWRKALVEAQRHWVAFRDAECALTGFEWYGGTGRSGAEIECARQLTEERTKALRRHADPR